MHNADNVFLFTLTYPDQTDISFADEIDKFRNTEQWTTVSTNWNRFRINISETKETVSHRPNLTNKLSQHHYWSPNSTECTLLDMVISSLCVKRYYNFHLSYLQSATKINMLPGCMRKLWLTVQTTLSHLVCLASFVWSIVTARHLLVASIYYFAATVQAA